MLGEPLERDLGRGGERDGRLEVLRRTVDRIDDRGARRARTAERVGPCFAPVRIAAAVEAGEENSKPASEDDRRMRQLAAGRNGLIEIDLGNRRRIRVDAHVDPEALARVLDVLERR